MANTKISQLPSWSGTAADLRWFVMNNSGETETYKFSGYATSVTFGSGTESIKSTNAVGSSGTNSIAIGKGAAASGNDSVCIGDIASVISSSAGTNSVIVGKHAQISGNNQVIIGSAAYAVGNGAIAIGADNASYATGAIVMGGGSKATAQNGITIGNNNERNIGEFSTIIGYNNRIAEAPDYYGGIYNHVISNNSWINCNNGSGGYNSIFGGNGNYITGTTSGATLINCNNFTDTKRGDFIVNNDGNNIVGQGNYKISIGGNGNTFSGSGSFSTLINGQYNSINGGFASIIGGYSNTISGGTNYSSILGGQFNTNVGNYSSIIAGRYNNILSAATEYSTIIGSYSSTTGGDYSHIFGGVNNRIDSPQAVIVGGLDNYIGPQSDNSEMIGSRNSVISGQSQDTTLINTIDTNSNGYDRVVMLGTSGRTATSSDTTYVENIKLFGTFKNDVYTGASSDLRWFLMTDSGQTTTYKFSGYTSQLIPGQGVGSYITPGSTAGSNSLAIGDGNTAGGGQSFMIGYNNTDNFNNRITAFGSGNNLGSAWSIGIGYGNDLIGFNFSTESILIGYENTINSTGVNTGNINIGQSQTISDGSYNTILNGKSNALQGGYYNNIFNGSGNTLSSSYSGVSMLSCFGRTASASNTTHVENLHIYRTPSTTVQPISSGTTFTCDLNNGGKAQYYITGTSTVNITNVRDGQSFMIKTQTDGNYVMTWTATGYTFVFEGGLKDPGNNVIDIFDFDVFGTTIYGSRRHNFS